ncbi:MAG: hypothetical protein N2652_00800 [Kiritimatiellae bacterium]|nr:hypothetical protein [Kiritimatiellia bacterium]
MRPANPDRSVAIELPLALQSRISAVRKRLRRLESALAAGLAATGATSSFLVLYVCDRLCETPSPVRWLCSIAGALSVALPFARWWWRWMWAPADLRQIARRIQRRIPALGDRLLGAVELADPQSGCAANASAPLRRAAIEQVAREADLIDVRAAAPAGMVQRIAVIAVGLFAAVTLLAVRHPEPARNALHRWLRPMASIARFTFVRIGELPAEMIVPLGEPFELECSVQGGKRRRPLNASCRVGRMRWKRFVGEEGRVRFQLPGQNHPAWLTLRVGDAIRHLRLRPEQRPALVELTATIRSPPWHGRGDETRLVEAGWLTVPEAGAVMLRGRTTRDLVAATLNGAEGPPMKVADQRFETPWLLATTTSPLGGSHRLPDELVINWRDVLGLTPAVPLRLRVQRVPDAPPRVRCEGLEGAVAILEDETLQFDVVATDDVGVRRIWVEWRAAPQGTSAGGAGQMRMVAEGAADQSLLRGTVAMSPDALRWPPDTTIELWAAALDYAPDRGPSYTPVYRILVVSRARHAQLLEQQARAIQAVVEELRRREEARRHLSDELAALGDRELTGAINDERLRGSESGEQRDAERASKLAEEAARLALEALRNPAIAEASVLEWAMIAERLQAVAAGAMRSAAETLGAAGRSTTAGRRREQVRQASMHQRTATDQLASILRDAASAGDEWASRSFLERLRELSQHHASLAVTLQKQVSTLAGLYPSELDPERRAELARWAELQARRRDDARNLRDDLAGFYERSRRRVYGEIREAMSNPDVVERHDESRHAILENHVMAAMALSRQLAEDFARWAELLAPNSSGSSAGGIGGQTPSLPPEVLMGLLRARARQESLREATRQLDRERSEREDYRAAANTLADRQEQIETDLRKLNDLVGGRVLQWMETIEQTMLVSAATLREPQTDAAAIAIQTEIIESIAAALSAATGSPSEGQPAPSAEAMSAVTRMLEALARAGGGSLAGGNTSRASSGPDGAGEGTSPSARPSQRAAGTVDEAVPAEFREVLEGYFRAIERQP